MSDITMNGPPAPMAPHQGGKDNPAPAISVELVLSELREIKQQVSELKEIKQQISKIESTTGPLVDQLTGVMNRTSELETGVRTNAARLREYDDQFSTMKDKVDKHEESLSDLSVFKQDFSNLKTIQSEFSKTKTKAVSDMNKLISIQKDQVDSFHEDSRNLSKNLMAEVDQKITASQKAQSASLHEATEELSVKMMAAVDQKFAKLSRQNDFQTLKDQAFNNRFNLVVVGLEEDPNKETSAILNEFFVKDMKLKNVKFDAAYRIGSAPSDTSSSYARPVLVHFSLLPHRNRVWRKRSSIPEGTGGQKTRIHADLPKQLRDDVQALYKVAKAANSSDQYQSANVRDYQLELDGQVFLPSELEMLPMDIRPSTLAAPRSQTALAFYSKYTIFSNHHPSVFYVNGQKFHTMEQFLACRRAQLSGQPSLIQKAAHAVDPVQAKYVLSALRENNTQQWDDLLESVVMEGLGAKFRQNQLMADYLCDTKSLILGEASTNPRWGVGIPIEDKDILDVSKWNESGNLLGRSLMKLRTILTEERDNSMT